MECTTAQPDESQRVDDIQPLVSSSSRRDYLVCLSGQMVLMNNSTNTTSETGCRDARGNASANVLQSEKLAVTSSANCVNANYKAAPDNGKNSSLDQNQNISVDPTSMHVPSQVQPTEDKDQFYNQVPATEQSEEGRSYMEGYQQSRGIKMEKPFFTSQQIVREDHPPPLKTRPDENYKSVQQSDNTSEQKDDTQGKKVFILHSIPDKDPHGNSSLLSFATALRDNGINVSIDLFEKDKSNDNWSMWCEREILSADVVLCIITPSFYKSITEGDRIKGLALYSSMSDSTKDIVFRPVFLDTEKNMEYVPLSMRGATCYCISSGSLNLEDEEFISLYAFLTGQNRVEKPKLGKVIKLQPKRSRFGQVRSQHPPVNRDVMYQQRSPQPSDPVSSPKNDQAYLIFQLLGKDTTQVKSLRSQKMFMTLAQNMTAKWEVLARMLNLKDSDEYHIKTDYRDSVQEQAVQMFRKWLENNGSAATLGVLTTAVYESGSEYWNLLDIINKHAPKK